MNAFVKKNGSVNAREIRKPKKTDLGFFLKQKVFFYRKPATAKRPAAAVPRGGAR